MIMDSAELKRRYLKRLAGARDNKVYIGPEVVNLDIINKCNLRCKFCATDHAPNNPRHHNKLLFLSWDKFIEIISDCVDLKVDQIDFGGSGEPTMHPLFGEMMSYLKQKPFWTRLTTNASFLSAICSDVVKVDDIVINLGAVDRQHYRDIYGKDMFAHVIRNIKSLVSFRDNHKKKLCIAISYVVNSMNFDQREEIHKLASRLGINRVYFRKMNVRSCNWQIALPEGSCQVPGEDKRTPSACFNGWFYLTLRLDGKASYCFRFHQTQPGDINKLSLKKIWLSKQMMNRRLLAKYGQLQKQFKECQRCPFYDDNVDRLKDLKKKLMFIKSKEL